MVISRIENPITQSWIRENCESDVLHGSHSQLVFSTVLQNI
jgi:hypothetical protein